MTIKERIIKDYPIGTHFRDLVHNEIFVVRSHDFDDFGMPIQLYIPVEKHPRLKNQTARIYENGKFAEKVEQSKFEVGKWYKSNICRYYGKFLRIGNTPSYYFVTSEKITDSGYSYKEYGFNNDKKWELLTDLSEIQHFLPNTHPDKINKVLPNSAITSKKLSEFKYLDVIHIETEEEYNKVKSVLKNEYSTKYKYYLVGGSGGLSESRKLYENQKYVIYEMNQIIFEETINKEALLEEAKRRYKIGDIIIDADFGDQVEILNTNFCYDYNNNNIYCETTLGEKGKSLYNDVYRDGKWAQIVKEKKYKYEVVHCTTQEEWDIVVKKLGYDDFNYWDFYKQESCINIKSQNYARINGTAFGNGNAKVYSFKEWCLTQGIETKTTGLYNQVPKEYINSSKITFPEKGIQFYYPKREKSNKKEVKNIKIIKTNLITI